MSGSSGPPYWQRREHRYFNQLEAISKKSDKKPVYSLLILDKKDRLAQKDQFLKAYAAGDKYLPDLTPRFDPANVSKFAGQYREFRQAIKSYKPRSAEGRAVKSAYRWKANAIIGDLRIALTAREGDMRRFNAYNAYVYDRPDPELFADELQSIRLDAQQLVGNEITAEAATDVLAVLPSLGGKERGPQPNPGLDPEIFKTVKDTYAGFMALSLAGIEVPETVRLKKGIKLADRILANIGAQSRPFAYSVQAVDAPAASVNHATELMKYPRENVYHQDRFIALFGMHEALHIRDRILGYKTGFRLLSGGLDRSEASTEGRATLAELASYEIPDDFYAQPRFRTITMRHLAACLALGVDGQPRDFYEVFRVIEPVYRMYELRGATNQEEAKAAPTKAAEEAWNLLANRILKGTHGKGSAYRKDMIYAEGHRAYLELARDEPRLLPYWGIGKEDLTSVCHIGILQTLGILPKFIEN